MNILVRICVHHMLVRWRNLCVWVESISDCGECVGWEVGEWRACTLRLVMVANPFFSSSTERRPFPNPLSISVNHAMGVLSCKLSNISSLAIAFFAPSKNARLTLQGWITVKRKRNEDNVSKVFLRIPRYKNKNTTPYLRICYPGCMLMQYVPTAARYSKSILELVSIYAAITCCTTSGRGP